MVELRGRWRKARLSFLAQVKAINHQGGSDERAEFSFGCILCSHFISSMVVCVIQSESIVQGAPGGLLEAPEMNKRDVEPQAIAFIPASAGPSDFIYLVCWAST